MTRESKRVRRWTVRPPRPCYLDDARHLAGQAMKILASIPVGLAQELARAIFANAPNMSPERRIAQMFDAAKHEGKPLSQWLYPAKPQPLGGDDGRSIKSLAQEAHGPPLTPPGPGKPGYVKEIVVRYKLRRIPYGARLVGRGIFHSRDAFELFKGLRYEPREHIMVVHLNAGNRVISVDHAATGTPTECPFSASVVFRDAMLAGAAAIIIVHNHPSGLPRPSQGDLALMDEAKRSGDLLRIPVLDFIIVGDDTYWSASDRCLLGRAPGTIPAPAGTRPKASRTRSAKRMAAGSAARRGDRRSGASGN